jgi:hypothetical protein
MSGWMACVRLAYQPPANSIFLSEQISQHQLTSSIFLSQQIITRHQPPAKRTVAPEIRADVLLTFSAST